MYCIIGGHRFMGLFQAHLQKVSCMLDQRGRERFTQEHPFGIYVGMSLPSHTPH